MDVYIKSIIFLYGLSLLFLFYLNSRPTRQHIYQNELSEPHGLSHFKIQNLDSLNKETKRKLAENGRSGGLLDNEFLNVPFGGNENSGLFNSQLSISEKYPNTSSQEVTFNSTLLDLYSKHTMKYREMGLCAKLFKNDSKALETARKLHDSGFGGDFHIQLEQFPFMTKDCYIYKKARGFSSVTPSKEEIDYPLAFTVLTYNNIEQLERFLRVLYQPQNVYCIHVDNKSSEAFKGAVKSITDCFSNIFIASKLETIVYASFSRLQADFNCMEVLINRPEKWKYHLNFASSEMILKSNLEMVRILKLFDGANDIHEVYSKRVKHRYLYKYGVKNGKITRIGGFLSPPPFNLTITKGQAYNIFSRRFIEFALKNKFALIFKDWCRGTYSPDEHFWATLNNLYHNSFLNTPGGYKGFPDSKTYVTRHINWRQSWDHCYGEYVRNICVFGYGDLPLLKRKGHFATNKFDAITRPIAYSCMEELVSERQKDPVHVDTKFWKSKNFIQNSNKYM